MTIIDGCLSLVITSADGALLLEHDLPGWQNETHADPFNLHGQRLVAHLLLQVQYGTSLGSEVLSIQ